MNHDYHVEDRLEDEADGPVSAKRSPGSLTGPEMLRFSWRQLTSMRTALFLLMLLAIASVPGSLFPQVGFDAAGVARFLRDNPGVGPWLQRLQFFQVYSSVWFSAIYLLLFISLIGCIVPRALVHARATRSRPPRTPARFTRLPEYRSLQATAPPAAILQVAAEYLRRHRFRVDVRPDQDGAASVAAERGHHRESGNVLFHVSLVGLLVCFATSSLYSFSGQRVVVEGNGFVGAATDLDSFTAGAAADENGIPPFRLTLQDMEVSFEAQQTSQIGQPRQFSADVLLSAGAGPEREHRIEVNKPANVEGTQISLSGNGYAPVLTVRDGAGSVVSEGAVPFLPQTGNYDSSGVVKVPDAVDASGNPRQFGLQGVFLPTATVDAANRPVSGFPGLGNPFLVFTVWVGDLGLESGVPQSVYELDNSAMTQALDAQGRPLALQLTPGQTAQLPDGLGSVTLESVARFAAFDVRRTPGQMPALVFSLLATAGLVASLFVPRRRVWVRVRGGQGEDEPLLEIAGLSRGADAGLAAEVDGIFAFMIDAGVAELDQASASRQSVTGGGQG
jgi:cytochrome c biogenesis protein